MQVDSNRNLLFVRGAVPGPTGSFVHVRDSIIRAWQPAKYPLMAQRPVPTFLGGEKKASPEEGESDESDGGVATAAWDRPDPNRLGQDMDAGDKNPLKASKAAAGSAKKGGKR